MILRPTGSPGTAVGAGSTHAWADIYVPGSGWIAYDPTNGTINGANLIRVAVTRDISQAVPIAGSFVGTPETYLGMTVDVAVAAEAPRTPQARGAPRRRATSSGTLGRSRRRAPPIPPPARRPHLEVARRRPAWQGSASIGTAGDATMALETFATAKWRKRAVLYAVRADRAHQRAGHARHHHRVRDRVLGRSSSRAICSSGKPSWTRRRCRTRSA